MQYAEESKEYNEFKKQEKFYRFFKGDFKKDISDIIDLNNPELDLNKFGITTQLIKGYTVYKFKQPEGIYLIKNYLPIATQVECCVNCLNEYIKKPFRTNMYVYDEGYTEADGTKPKDYSREKFIVNDPKRYFFNRKIRWTNLGFQYDWNNRFYPNVKTSVPDNMRQLAMEVISLLDLGSYVPESVIINFYDKKNHMTGHLDDGEKDQISPIISFSVGLSCVFLMGENTKDVKPLAIRLDSGDVFIMSKHARTCYHGVPRVIEDSLDAEPFENYLKEKYQDEEHAKLKELGDRSADEETELPKNNEYNAVNYLKENRLNFNFRQVEVSNDGA